MCYYLYTASRKQPPIVDNNNIIETEEVEEKKKERETIKALLCNRNTLSRPHISPAEVLHFYI